MSIFRRNAMRYGIPYQGSKNAIAEKVVNFLPFGDCLVDIFAGGCAITHAALLSCKWDKVIANDLGEAPQIFKAAIDGQFKGYATVPDRAQFFAEKDADPVMALLYSFGNDGSSYLWGKDIEGVKVYASRMLSAPSEYERRMYYKRFMRELKEYMDKYCTTKLSTPNGDGAAKLQGLEALERLERLQALERLQGLQGLEVLQLDYRQVRIPSGAVVYADPPYRDTSQDCNHSGHEFDFAAFDEWLAEVDFPVYVSEYTCPVGCVEVAAFERVGHMSATNNANRVQEKIFIQERFA